MDLSKQVVSLEQAKRLKELGISAFGYAAYYDNMSVSYDKGLILSSHTSSYMAFGKIEDTGLIRYFPAFTVAELGEMMPYYLVNKGELTIKKNYRRHQLTGWNSSYQQTVNDKGEPIPRFCAETQAQAMVLMLIYLLENKLTTASECNKRLTT